jgi:hypothetical protein
MWWGWSSTICFSFCFNFCLGQCRLSAIRRLNDSEHFFQPIVSTIINNINNVYRKRYRCFQHFLQ